MSRKIAITPSTFATEDQTPLETLRAHGCEVVVNKTGRRLNEAETIEILKDVDGVLAGLEPLNEKTLSGATRLKALARVGIGMDNVDMAVAAKLGIKVSNTPDGPTEAVAELALAALLALLRQIVPSDNALHAGKWEKRIGFGLKSAPVLLVGFGRIGRRFAEMLAPFKPDLMVCDPARPDLSAFPGAKSVSLEEGLSKAKIVSLHANAKSVLLGAKEFKLLKPGAVLLNSARGHLVDETALLDALNGGVLSGAWFDVFKEEPYKGPLTGFPQVLLTPHVSSYTVQCRLEMEMAATLNLLRDLGLTK
jgi:D-3-phosphoglycerate dehydrogenase